MARYAERLQILQMMRAAERAVQAHTRDAMIDLEAIALARLAPRAHGGVVRRGRDAAFRRTLHRNVAAPRAAVLIAALCRAARERPPMVFPKAVGTAVAAPGAPALGKLAAAPRAALRRAMRERTVRE